MRGLLRIRRHGAELEHRELLHVRPEAGLAIEHRARRLTRDAPPRPQEQGRGKHQPDGRSDEVDRPFDSQGDDGPPAPADADEWNPLDIEQPGARADHLEHPRHETVVEVGLVASDQRVGVRGGDPLKLLDHVL